jgi:hypothetical protein
MSIPTFPRDGPVDSSVDNGKQLLMVAVDIRIPNREASSRGSINSCLRSKLSKGSLNASYCLLYEWHIGVRPSEVDCVLEVPREGMIGADHLGIKE